jgi:hypothetical protein
MNDQKIFQIGDGFDAERRASVGLSPLHGVRGDSWRQRKRVAWPASFWRKPPRAASCTDLASVPAASPFDIRPLNENRAVVITIW